MTAHGSSTLKTACSLAELICRPELSYKIISDIDPDRPELDSYRAQREGRDRESLRRDILRFQVKAPCVPRLSFELIHI